MDTKELKSRVTEEVDSQQERLRKLALEIHANPELGLKEAKAAEWLTAYLEENGFSVERGTAGLPTAFRAGHGKGKPVIAILAEYDALPEVGHGCGHNLICTSAVAAGVALKPTFTRLGGTILVIGTPGEEGYGGKIKMANKGAFSDLDIAMIVHPSTYDAAAFLALAVDTLEVEFLGKAAHAATQPESGINALEAMLQSFAAINSLRQHIKSTSRIHGIITDGGAAPNVVPAHSAGSFMVRAEDDTYLDELKEKVLDCFRGAATATGAQLKYRWADERYSTIKNNHCLGQLFTENMKTMGRTVIPTDPETAYGATDMGNVSQIVPSLHGFFAIAEKGTSLHTPEFAAVAASEAGINGMLDAAKALAMIAVDLLADPALLAKAREEFEEENDNRP